mmetsp:Transcript_60998/g.127874  ORF Transcript_60998/g.127874 Transcript_60998/m.127874 type:complete len:113 (+) Transcript_60998:1280-1618(+)
MGGIARRAAAGHQREIGFPGGAGRCLVAKVGRKAGAAEGAALPEDRSRAGALAARRRRGGCVGAGEEMQVGLRGGWAAGGDSGGARFGPVCCLLLPVGPTRVRAAATTPRPH